MELQQDITKAQSVQERRLGAFLKNNFLLIAIVILGITIRSFMFGSIPAGLNQDEASIGYDSYAISHYGIDRNGNHNPIYLISWGSGQNALYAYLSMPFIYIMGLNVFSVRFVNLLFGIITLIVFYLLIKKVANQKLALLSVFLLCISPWHIMLSRWALESNLFPAFFLTGTYALILSLERKLFLYISVFLFGLSLYSYGLAYFVVPLFLVLTFIYMLIHKKINLRELIASTLLFTLTVLPVFLFTYINIYKKSAISTGLFTIPRLIGQPRYTTQLNLFSDNFLEKSFTSLKGFLNLLYTQNDGFNYNAIPEFGIIYLMSLPFFILGLVRVISFTAKGIREKKFSKNLILLLWLLSALILPFITFEPNINRFNIIFIPIIFVTAAGIHAITSRIKEFSIPTISLYLVFFLLFASNYFTQFPNKTSASFHESLGDAIHFAAEKTNGNICVTNKMNMPYIFVLFYEKTDPRVFVDTVKYANPGGEFQEVRSFDRYYFGIDNGYLANAKAFVILNEEKTQFSPAQYSIREFKNYAVAIKK
ncbi:MAG: glycosyltransferase family 39 protein [Clostridia bacterium]|nr:glycosyltransferase family 39 protein [Clostridia bacterium]